MTVKAQQRLRNRKAAAPKHTKDGSRTGSSDKKEKGGNKRKGSLALFFKRRKFIINKVFQYRLLFYSFLYIAFFFLVLAASLFIPLILNLNRPEGVDSTAYDSATQFLYLHKKFWPVALMTLVVLGLHSILTSHRIAGPLYRFKLVFKAIAAGRLPRRISLRKGDFFHVEKEDLNKMLDALNDRLEAIKASGRELSRAVRECSSRASDENVEDLLERVARLEQHVWEFEKRLDLIKSGDG